MFHRSVVQALHTDSLVVAVEDGQMDDVEQLTDLELLSTALHEALEAQQNGVVIGPAVDELSLHRAERSARRADGRQQHITLVLGGAA